MDTFPQSRCEMFRPRLAVSLKYFGRSTSASVYQLGDKAPLTRGERIYKTFAKIVLIHMKLTSHSSLHFPSRVKGRAYLDWPSLMSVDVDATIETHEMGKKVIHTTERSHFLFRVMGT